MGTENTPEDMPQEIHVGLDIGGTLAKLVLIGPRSIITSVASSYSSSLMVHEKFSTDENDISAIDLGFDGVDGSAFEMFSFDSRNISPLLQFLRDLSHSVDGTVIDVRVTGGGALKFKDDLHRTLPTAHFTKVDEMDAVAAGFSFLVRRPNSAFIFDSSNSSWTPVPSEEVESPFPLLLVNIGSGVSVLKIDSPAKYERVQGSAIGGGTVLGLGRALFNAQSFEEIMELSMKGNSNNVDLSVGELIGALPNDDFWNFDTLASSLTKLNSSDIHEVSRADLAQSIVRMVSYNIGYIAYLVSCLHDCNRIYFSGKYVNKHVPTMEALSYALRFYENWQPPPIAEESVDNEYQLDSPASGFMERHCEVRFLHQEGYVGAIGALIPKK
jgi:type II pantothenate kinase